MLRSLSAVYPMFGDGRTRLQPACVDDVAAAIAAMMQQPETGATIFECGGPRVYTYEQLLRTIAEAAGLKPRLLPLPFAAWHMLAAMAEMLPRPPVTRNQVELMQIDSVQSPDMPGFRELGITPRPVEEILRHILASG